MGPTRAALVFAIALCVGAAGSVAAQAQQPPPSPAPSAEVASPPPLPSPKPGPDDPARHKLAVQQFLAWQSGVVDRTLYGDEVNTELSDEVLDQATKTLANMGALQSAVFVGTARAKGLSIYVYKMTCEHGSVNMDFALQPDGKIALIFFE
ncbi:MAG TPA: hypothetical protein VFH72_02200 [Candidatus Baltobacteraceae bacterium]|nr:hypothetical protein [Candidatus Baltobacteraceae bacterium]